MRQISTKMTERPRSAALCSHAHSRSRLLSRVTASISSMRDIVTNTDDRNTETLRPSATPFERELAVGQPSGSYSTRELRERAHGRLPRHPSMSLNHKATPPLSYSG